MILPLIDEFPKLCPGCGGRHCSTDNYPHGGKYCGGDRCSRSRAIDPACPDPGPVTCGCAGDDATIPFDDQLQRILSVLDYPERVAFLAGVRFVQGHAEYGDSMFTMPTERLRFEALQEDADGFLYGKELEAREEDSRELVTGA